MSDDAVIDAEYVRVADPVAIPTTILVKRPDVASLLRQANGTNAVVTAITIDSPEMLEIGNEQLGEVKAFIKRLEADEEAAKRELLDTLNAIREDYRGPLETLRQCETLMKKSIADYLKREKERVEREQREQEEQARRAREAAARDAARVEAEARERAAKIAADAKAAAEAGDAGRAAALQVKAQQAEEAGAQRAADIEAAGRIVVAAPVVAAAKAKGFSIGTTWKGEVQDKGKALAFVAQNPQWHHLVEFPQAELDKAARSMKGGMSVTLPGLKSIEVDRTSKR